MLFNNPYTAAHGTKLDVADNNRWEVPIPKINEGPYTIIQVYYNVTIRIQRGYIWAHQHYQEDWHLTLRIIRLKIKNKIK